MKVERTERGFEIVRHLSYANDPVEERLVQASSVIGEEYADAWDRPGTSALWIGSNLHLYREEVAELVSHLQAWLATGSLVVKEGE